MKYQWFLVDKENKALIYIGFDTDAYVYGHGIHKNNSVTILPIPVITK